MAEKKVVSKQGIPGLFIVSIVAIVAIVALVLMKGPSMRTSYAPILSEDYVADDYAAPENIAGEGKMAPPSAVPIVDGCLDNNCITDILDDNRTYYCYDTDGSPENYYQFGVVTGGDNFGYNYNVSDVCTGSSYLVEYGCSNVSYVSTGYHCPSGCTNGACISNITSTPYSVD